jgi:hypothetical protein
VTRAARWAASRLDVSPVDRAVAAKEATQARRRQSVARQQHDAGGRGQGGTDWAVGQNATVGQRKRVAQDGGALMDQPFLFFLRYKQQQRKRQKRCVEKT